MFTGPQEFVSYLEGLIDRHENDLSIILSHLGIANPPTPARLIYAYEKFPIRFTQLLSELEGDLSFTGVNIAGSAATKQTGLQKLFSAGKDIIGAFKGESASPAPANGGDEPKPKKISTKRIIIIGVVVIVVITVAIILIKKFKK